MAAFRDMDDATLLAEFEQWDRKVKTATGWGAALMQAAGWRDACGRILAERGLMQDFEPRIPEAVEPAITPEMLRAGISVAEAHFRRAHGTWRDLVVAVYRAMYLSRPSRSDETEATLSRNDVAENSGGGR